MAQQVRSIKLDCKKTTFLPSSVLPSLPPSVYLILQAHPGIYNNNIHLYSAFLLVIQSALQSGLIVINLIKYYNDLFIKKEKKKLFDLYNYILPFLALKSLALGYELGMNVAEVIGYNLIRND